MCLNPPPSLNQVPEDFGIVSLDAGQTQIKAGDYSWIIIGNPYDMPVNCHLVYEKPMKLTEEDMQAWIPGHMVFKGN